MLSTSETMQGVVDFCGVSSDDPLALPYEDRMGQETLSPMAINRAYAVVFYSCILLCFRPVFSFLNSFICVLIYLFIYLLVYLLINLFFRSLFVHY